MKNILLVVLSVGLSLIGVELFLRFQPFITLDYPAATMDPEARLSYVYHHRKPDRPEVLVERVGEGCVEQEDLTVLFLGDSWMEDLNGIPMGFAESVSNPAGAHPACVRIVNAGVSSFSPSLMLLKGRSLFAQYQPALIVVQIDATDIMDESLRYAGTLLRDAEGHIDRVVPNVIDLARAYERATLRQQPSFTLRLIEHIYYQNVFIPRLFEQVYGNRTLIGSYESILAPQLSANPYRTHAREIAYFSDIVREMVAGLSQTLPAERLVLTRHPHYLHVASDGERSKYSSILPRILGKIAEDTGVQFYDAEGDLLDMYGGEFEKYTNWPEDPFSHLTQEGYRLYGRALASAVRLPIE